MNILILIFSFLAVLGLGTASFWQLFSSIRQETAAFCGFLTANRNNENALQKKLYNNLPCSEPGKPRQQEKSKKACQYLSRRLKKPPHQYARLQLAALWKEETHPFVEKTLRRLFYELYGHMSWFAEAERKGEVHILIDALIRFGKEQKGPFAIHELLSSLPLAQADLLHKMVQGTHTYSLKAKKGYPPLLDFVSFSFGSIKQTCHFPFASLPLLRAFFDEDTVQEIMTLEKTKWEKDHKRHTCTKKELLGLLQNSPLSPTQPSSLDIYFHFGQHAGAHDTITAYDPITGIHTSKKY